MFSRKKHCTGIFYRLFDYDVSDYGDEEAIDDYMAKVIANYPSNIEVKGYEIDGCEVHVSVEETQPITIIEYGRYEPPDEDYELEDIDCLRIFERGYEIQ